MSLTYDQERQAAKETADRLAGAFVWAETPQGARYWKGVYDNLIALSREKEDDE